MLILGHASVDLAAGALFALLPFLVAERDYTLAAVGTFALVANVTNGACQPLFGPMATAGRPAGCCRSGSCWPGWGSAPPG